MEFYFRNEDKCNNTKYIKEYFTDNVACTKIGSEWSELIKVTKDLDNCEFYLIFVGRKLWITGRKTTKEWSCQTKKINACSLLTMVTYLVIIVQDADDLELILKRLDMTYKKWGLKINFN